MPITRIDHPDGSWEEKADDPKSVRELREKHDPALQRYGAEKFHEAWLNQQKVGFERVVDPQGNVTHVTADKADAALASGYRPMNRPRTVVPTLPWHKDRKPNYGRHKFRYDPESKTMREVT